MMQRVSSSMRRARRFSTQAQASASAARPQATRQVEYPTSFLSHLKTQKLNVFNIGIAFLTLSLSSQLVTFKQKNEKLTADNTELAERVQVLEELVVSLGGTVPTDEAKQAAIAAAEAAALADAERVKKAREEEARALTAAVAAATTEGGDAQPQKKKGVLI